MRKIITIALIAAITTVSLSAEAIFEYDIPFGWQSPEIMAQGGSFTAIASGFNALMTNPAGFAMSKTYKYVESENEDGERVVEKKERGEVTVLGVLPYAMINPFTLKEDLAQADDASQDAIIDAILNQSSTNGIGAGVQAGIGYVGYGFGFGFINTVDMMFPQTDNILGISGDITATTALVGGYAHKFDFGFMKLAVGADIRPMWRVKVKDININTVLGFMGGGDGSDEIDLSTIDALTGFAIGFDVGAIAEISMFSFGASLRDIGHTRYLYQSTNLDSLMGDPLHGEEYTGLDYVTPMTLRLGAAIHPDLGRLSRFVDPKAHIEYVIPMIIDDKVADYDAQSFWVNLHAGAEVRLLSFLSLRAGYASGYLSAGLGIDFVIGELNAALYSIETGSHSGSNQQMGAAVEFAFRF
ncbi:hypothetical protein [Spirochaeta isovalerica]|uniref:DUF5723 domain-containing protein n=1 Tax=Spirochaeta isovalerica TaxID=150 RepID=A0A841RE41_9SPIO|nr:hypothetical protein [Spirochaeta isovalerica]MBB6480632.1 hypothetical protein [Spirochaeta isovalerica]